MGIPNLPFPWALLTPLGPAQRKATPKMLHEKPGGVTALQAPDTWEALLEKAHRDVISSQLHPACIAGAFPHPL